jgi:hypothetical protein
MIFENANVHQKGSYLKKKKIEIYSKKLWKKKELNFGAIFWFSMIHQLKIHNPCQIALAMKKK